MKVLEAPKAEITGIQRNSLPTKIEQQAQVTQSTQANPDVFTVTDKGVVLPKEAKYQIPSNYIENTQHKYPNSTIYGIVENGEFVEKLRIDRATLPGAKGPNVSHFHLNGKSKHYIPGGKNNRGF